MLRAVLYSRNCLAQKRGELWWALCVGTPGFRMRKRGYTCDLKAIMETRLKQTEEKADDFHKEPSQERSPISCLAHQSLVGCAKQFPRDNTSHNIWWVTLDTSGPVVQQCCGEHTNN